MDDSAPIPHVLATPQPESYSMAGMRALVTGAGRGIGRAIALRLATAGADVCIAARTAEEIDATVDAIAEAGGSGHAIVCDLNSETAAASLVEAAVERLGGLSVLVNNAGGAHRVQPIDALSVDDFERGTMLNYRSVYLTLRAAAPHLFAAAPDAAVVNVVSIAAQRGLAGMAYYSGAKAGVVGLTRAAAREWGPRGVRVNSLAPGWIATDLSRHLLEDETFASATLPHVALGRWGTPDDIAEAAAFLACRASRYITGATLYVDGGLLA